MQMMIERPAAQLNIDERGEGEVRGGERSKGTMCFVGTCTFNWYGGGYSGWYITANHCSRYSGT